MECSLCGLRSCNSKGSICFPCLSLGPFSNVDLTCRGFAAVILQVLYYAAPLSTFGEVISKKSSASLYPPGCFMNTVNSALWAIYGLVSTPPNLRLHASPQKSLRRNCADVSTSFTICLVTWPCSNGHLLVQIRELACHCPGPELPVILAVPASFVLLASSQLCLVRWLGIWPCPAPKAKLALAVNHDASPF